MKKCNYCHVEVDTDKNFCPLCFNKLEQTNVESEQFYTLRSTNETTLITNRFLYKLFIFISICIVSICAIINLLTSPKTLWFLVVLFSVLYVWVLVAHTILSKQSAFRKVFLQLLSLFVLLYSTQRLSAFNWLLSYVFPSVSLCAVTVSLMLLFISKKRNEFLIGFAFIYLLLCLSSIFIVALYSSPFHILNIINVILCSLSFVGVFVFGFGAMKNELMKKWHL